MATGVPSGTILAVQLQKCLHLSNEIKVMQKIYDIFSDFHRKDGKILICNIS
jgi:hypothetical protein